MTGIMNYFRCMRIMFFVWSRSEPHSHKPFAPILVFLSQTDQLWKWQLSVRFLHPWGIKKTDFTREVITRKLSKINKWNSVCERILVYSPYLVWCSADRATLYNFSKRPTWRTIILFYNTFITVLYMFRATSCSSSGGQIVLIQHLVSPLSVSGRPVHRTATYR